MMGKPGAAGGESAVNILGIAGSPRVGGNSAVMLEAALEGAREVDGVKTSVYQLGGRKITPCIGCMACTKDGRCHTEDDFEEFFHTWLAADGLIYASPVYHLGVPAILKAALERLGHVMFSYYNRRLPVFLKVGGVMAQGTSRFGGQELTITYLVQHLLLMNCLVVTGDTPACYIGAPAQSATVKKKSIVRDTEGLAAARNLGHRVAEVTKIVRAGIRSTGTQLGGTTLD